MSSSSSSKNSINSPLNSKFTKCVNPGFFKLTDKSNLIRTSQHLQHLLASTESLYLAVYKETGQSVKETRYFISTALSIQVSILAFKHFSILAFQYLSISVSPYLRALLYQSQYMLIIYHYAALPSDIQDRYPPPEHNVPFSMLIQDSTILSCNAAIRIIS